MKWYVIPSVITCGLNCTLATLVLGLAAFHLYTDKSTNAPIEPNEEWISRMTALIPFSLVWMVVSLTGIFASMARNRIWLASVTLFLHTICLGGAIYFAYAFGAQLEMEDVPPETLFNITLNQINAQDPPWIPGWLDNVQKQSQQCCGILTYRDYQQFWAETPSKIPRSCCRDTKLPSPCPTDVTQIPYPHTPAIFYKVEVGCMDEINASVRQHIHETFQNCVVMAIFIGIGVLAFLLLFVKRYLVGNPAMEGKMKLCDGTECKRGGGDIEDANKEPRQACSEVEQGACACLVDSIDAIPPYAVSSIDSVAASPAGQASIDVNLHKEQKETPQHVGGAGSSARTNNAVFPGLQKQPEAATGDDNMTVNAGNMGKHEVFVAQDVPLADTPAGRIYLQPSGSTDDIGDIIHADDGGVGTPPGSPGGGRKKKVRKVGLAHHHHKPHHGHKEQ